MDCCDIWKKFNSDELTVKRLEAWTLVVRHKQLTLGSAVAILLEHREHFADVTQSEWIDLGEAIRWYEEALDATFEPEQFNYLALMMKDPHVHLHLVPRYSGAREFEGREWVDATWPRSVSMQADRTDPSVLKALATVLRKH